jgi:hypothetical protein
MRGLPGKKRWRRLYVTYALADSGAAGTFAADVAWQTDPTEDGLSYTHNSVLAESATATRKRMILGDGSDTPLAEGLTVTVGKASSLGNDFRVYKIEAELHPIEQSR